MRILPAFGIHRMIWLAYQYMPPMSGDAGIGGFFSGMSATRDSVVRTMAAV